MKLLFSAVVYAIFCLALSAQQQGDFALVGHRVGESFGEAIAKVHSSKLDDCRSGSAVKHTPSRDRDLTIKMCRALDDAREGRRAELGRGWLMGKPDELRIMFRFNRGVVTAIESSFVADPQGGISFEVLEKDAISKCGNPTNEGTTTWQNGFGARWNPRFAEFKKDDLFVRIEEAPPIRVSGDPFITIRIASIKDMAADQQDSEAKHQNVFDAK